MPLVAKRRRITRRWRTLQRVRASIELESSRQRTSVDASCSVFQTVLGFLAMSREIVPVTPPPIFELNIEQVTCYTSARTCLRLYGSALPPLPPPTRRTGMIRAMGRVLGCIACVMAVSVAGCSGVSSTTPPAPTPLIGCSSAIARAGSLLKPLDVAAVSGYPFGVVAIPNNDRAIVSTTTVGRDGGGSLETLQVRSGAVRLVSTVALIGTAQAYGIALSHDDRWLAVATGPDTLLVNVSKLLSGALNPVVATLTDNSRGQVEVAFSNDDRYVFVSDENSEAVSVFDISVAVASGFTSLPTAVGEVPLGASPVGLAVSPDGRWLYVAGFDASNGRGSLWVIDQQIASSNPHAAVVSHVAAGCSLVRVVLSPKGDTAWVTAQLSNKLLAFDTAALRVRPEHSLQAAIQVGSEPTGLALYSDGRYAVVTNSARFLEPGEAQTIMVVNLSAALQHRPAIKAWIAAGAFPREAAVDGNLGLVTNYNSDTVEVFRLP
mgnify:CR=1 FL=1